MRVFIKIEFTEAPLPPPPAPPLKAVSPIYERNFPEGGRGALGGGGGVGGGRDCSKTLSEDTL